MQSETQVVKPTAEQLAAILADHKLWTLGRGGKQADLRYADLRYADLRYADLRYADLRSADLSYADLSYANLRSADLSYANLRSADLSYANLRSADLRSADLRSADLSYADLSYADLSSADLSYANLQESKEAGLVLARTEIVPREGEVIGWKRCRDRVLVKLRVPPDSPRSNGLGRKCRAGRVEVLEVVGAEVGVSIHDGVTEYRVGATVTPSGWDPNRLNECSAGIHFYLTREEAEAHS